MTVRTDLSDRLGEQQKAILDILREAQAMLIDPVTHDIPGLARARWSLMRALTAYQLLKQSEIFQPAIARGNAGDVRRVESLRSAADAAVEAFRGNVTRWSAVDVAATWATYQASALAMIARLRELVTRERHELAALIGTGAAIPPPAVARPRPDRPTPAG